MKDTRPNPNQPLIVNHGIGVDSTAVLTGFAERGIVPDLIIHADVGSEKPETVAYIDTLNAWCRSVGFPAITVVARFDVVKAQPTTDYTTIEGNCLSNQTMPSIAFGFRKHSCSIKWKADSIARYLQGNARYDSSQPDGPGNIPGWPMAKAVWKDGGKVTHVIGYDNGVADCRRSDRNAKLVGANDTCPEHICDRWYPLQDWGWDRTDCVKAIAEAGLPIPVKSACFFCPASKPWEVLWLAGRHPDLFFRALAIEDNYQAGKHYQRVPNLYKVGKKKGQPKDKAEGLWFTKSWRGYAETEGLIEVGGSTVIMSPTEIKEKLSLVMPDTAGTDQLDWVTYKGQGELW